MLSADIQISIKFVTLTIYIYYRLFIQTYVFVLRIAELFRLILKTKANI